MSIIKYIGFVNKEKREAEKLALRIESYACQLNGLPTVDSNYRSLITILNSVCGLLESLSEQHKMIDDQKVQFHTQLESQSLSPEIETTTKPLLTEEVKAQVIQEAPPQIIESETPPEKPSTTAQELIRLRDWVLLANSRAGEDKANSQVLAAIYKQLGKILQKEGITTIEDTGKFDYERHQAVSTQTTDDQQKEDLIYDTVRPGYLFHDQLIRPQEVIVYTYEDSLAEES